MIETIQSNGYNKVALGKKETINYNEKKNNMANNGIDNNSYNILYEKLLEIKNDIKIDMKIEFDKLNSKVDSTSSVIVDMRLKNVTMEKDIQALQLQNSSVSKYAYLVIAGIISALVTGVMSLILK